MLVLAIDTASKTGGCALLKDGELWGEVLLGVDTTHSRRLMASLDFMLGQCGVAKKDLEGLAVNLGPGYFTGLRIGLASAQGLALGLDIPVWGASSLKLLAAGLLGARGLIWSVADARRGLVYAAPFEASAGGLTRLDEDAAMSPKRLAGLIEAPALLVGDGARLYSDELCGPRVELAPAAGDHTRPGLLALLGEQALTAGQGLAPEELRPRYVRPSDAEVRFGLPLDGYRLLDPI